MSHLSKSHDPHQTKSKPPGSSSDSERKAVIVAISGCSSSGKTTLARLLRDIFPNTFVLHEDDFYRREEELPTKHGMLDWDCAEAIDVPALVAALQHILQEGTFPPTLDSKEDLNEIPACPVPSSTITELKSLVETWLSPNHPGHILVHPFTTSSSSSTAPTPTSPLRICLLDGFLLYASPNVPSLYPVHPLLDIKFFLRTTYAKAKARRESRSGYVTIEGFWTDPEGYVEKVVWENYVRDHGWMFVGGDVEGAIDGDILRGRGIEWVKGQDEGDLEATLRWAVERLMVELPRAVSESRVEGK